LVTKKNDAIEPLFWEGAERSGDDLWANSRRVTKGYSDLGVRLGWRSMYWHVRFWTKMLQRVIANTCQQARSPSDL
jgi:hypothetical protein